jgi:hypothetical protein
MVFGRKRQFHVGDEFGKGSDSRRIKSKLIQYAKALKSAYLSPSQKRDIKVDMESLKRELAELKEQEKYYETRRTVKRTKERISKLKNESSGGGFGNFDIKVPDMLSGSGSSHGIKMPKMKLNFKI